LVDEVTRDHNKTNETLNSTFLIISQTPLYPKSRHFPIITEALTSVHQSLAGVKPKPKCYSGLKKRESNQNSYPMLIHEVIDGEIPKDTRYRH
jgi:hypothetical protein